MSLESFARSPLGMLFAGIDSAEALRARLATVERVTILRALKDSDPNGVYLDECQEEGDPPVTHEEAIDLAVDAWRDTQPAGDAEADDFHADMGSHLDPRDTTPAEPESASEYALDAVLAQVEGLDKADALAVLARAKTSVEAWS